MIRALALTGLLAVAIIFWPGLKSAALFNPIAHNQTTEIRIPRTWSALADEKALAVFTPCWTLFCTQIRSSVEVRAEPAFIGKEDAWLLRTQQTMKIMTSGTPTVARIGNFKCIEAGDQTSAACIGYSTGLIGAFKGSPADLEAFHAILETARRVG